MIGIQQISDALIKYGQEHLLKYWDELNEDQRKHLLTDIKELNLEELQTFYERATSSLNGETGEKLDDRLQPIPDEEFLSITHHGASKDVFDAYESIGLNNIAAGYVGVLLMAGGQGTRLGFSHPKGMYNVGLPSGKSLFQIQAERILALERLAYDHQSKGNRTNLGHVVWYIMTSEATMEPTRAYFEQHNYFGMNSTNIVMFEQGSLPCFGFDGKILMDTKYGISKAPDGNGGIYRALRDQGILDDMKTRGIKYLHAHSVDNILIKVADPIFMGYCIQQSAECAAKVVEKSQPHEAVGVICMVDGKYQVVEYSEISPKTSEMRNADGRLTFNAGNICNHFFSLSFLKKITGKFEKELKLHVAKKKIPFVDNAGVRITPETPNGIKIEKFVFDVFEFAEKFVCMEVLRTEEFSPLKNAESAGKECASTARNDIYRLHKKFIENAGGIVHGDVCEISPLLSYNGESLKHICMGNTFLSPVYLKSSMDSLNGHL